MVRRRSRYIAVVGPLLLALGARDTAILSAPALVVLALYSQ
jgi:hypothetical protein